MTLKEVQKMLSEKAKSRAQQRFFGMVRAAQKGEMDNPSSEVVDAADSMKVDDVKKFAKTKHKGLPEKKTVKEEPERTAAYKAMQASLHPRGSTSDAKQGESASAHRVGGWRKPYLRDRNAKRNRGFRKYAGARVNEASAVLDANTKIRTDKERKKNKAELAKLTHIYKGMKKGIYNSHELEGEQVNEIAPAIAMAGKALLSGGVKKAAVGAVKQKAKQAVKQKAAEVAGNVADKISKPIGGTRVQESKGTAELAGLALRNKKRCAECGSFTHVTGDCPKKDHGVVNKRTITSEAKEEEGRSDYGKASVRNKRRFGKEGKPAIFDTTNERGKMIDKRREEHKQRQAKSGVTEGVMDIVRKYTDKKKSEKKPEKAMDAGARAKRQLARKVHAKYVSGSTENVPDDIRDHKTWSDFRKHI